jgi:hypothetical protein
MRATENWIMQEVKQAGGPLCPSAQPEMKGAVVFGLVLGTITEPRVAYLAEAQPITKEVLALAGPVKPAEVFRLAAPCAGHGCQHFDGMHCGLATRTAQVLPPVTDALPACVIRPECRWWQQEGKAACMRCPQVVTESYHLPLEFRQAANPQTPAEFGSA